MTVEAFMKYRVATRLGDNWMAIKVGGTFEVPTQPLLSRNTPAPAIAKTMRVVEAQRQVFLGSAASSKTSKYSLCVLSSQRFRDRDRQELRTVRVHGSAEGTECS